MLNPAIQSTFTCYNTQIIAKLKRVIIIITFLIAGTYFSPIKAQETRVYSTNLSWYNEGLELFEKEKYSAAIRSFEKSQELITDKNSEAYVNSAYFKALCALNLFHKDAEYQLKEFVNTYPESAKVKNAYFQLGKYNYRKKKWDKVIYWFSKTDAFSFTNSDLYEYNFRMGYSYFRMDEYKKATPYFYELIDIISPYHTPANYYYAHIAYLEGNYATALRGFNTLRNDKKFGVIIPYYVSQIYYYQEEYDTLISYAKPMLDNEKTKRKPEISKLVGNAYFTKKEYSAAIPYLQFYLKEGDTPTREDYFQLAYAQMMGKDYEPAIKYFARISAKDDALAQKAIYNMADCYLKTDNKPYARNAFKKASEFNYNPSIAEESLLSYAKLSYELDYDPYSDAITAFIQYLQKYPDAIKKNEAFEYLVNIYLSTNNYRSALASLELTKDLDPRLREVYQQLQFNLAVEQFQNSNYKEAVNSFIKSQELPESKSLSAQATYWIAESHYRLGQYNKAIEEYQQFIFEPRALLLPEFKVSNYALGYAYYQNKDYSNSAKWFRKYLTYQDLSPTRKHDALLRTGDCYFITKNYLLSQEYYQKAFQVGGRNADYGLYQYAITQGLLDKNTNQNNSLEKLLKDFPESTYATGALYELGKNNMIAGKNEAALVNFNSVINSSTANPYRKKALENSGLIYYNMSQNDQALSSFKTVVTEYPNYQDSKTALKQIELIYKTTGDIDSYESYLATLDFMDISDVALDSLSYSSAEDFYMDNSYEKAASLFQKYIQRFDHPIFANNAHFYLAECEYKTSNLEEALANYSFNVKTEDPLFYNVSLERSAELSYKLGNYKESLRYFQQLQTAVLTKDEIAEIHWWSLKSASKIDSFKVVIDEGQTLLNDSIPFAKRDAEIKYLMATSYRAIGDTNNAMQFFREVSNSTQEEKSAASLYYIAEMLYENHNLDSSEKVIFEVAQHTPTYSDWLAKALILLSDIYVTQEDYFQARTTLESIVGNYTGDDSILNSAKEKLNTLTELENTIFDNQEETPVEEIDFNEDDTDKYNDDLFEEEELEEENIPTPNKPEDNE